MKIDLISTWISNYENSNRSNLLAFPTLINLAALIKKHDVSITYEQIRPINFDTDADLIGISFISPFADYTFKVADKFRELGKKVILGGPYASVFPQRCFTHADSVVIGEGEISLPQLVDDFSNNSLKDFYKHPQLKSLDNLPIPRWDLVTDDFIISQTITATRGCPFHCSFCFLKSFTDGFRVRPIKEVIRDIEAHEGKNWLQNKILWFWDDNLIGNKQYAKELFRKLKPLKKWWIAQVTADIAYDDELLRLARESGCVALYIGFESFNQKSLSDVNKFHNRVSKYRKIIKKIHNHGIVVSSGLMVGFDSDSVEVFDNSVKTMNELGIDWVNANIIVPFEGTELFNKLREENRILTNKSYYFNGSSTTFIPKLMTEEQLNTGFYQMVKSIFSIKSILSRFLVFIKDVKLKSIGAYLMFFSANLLFHVLKRKVKPVEYFDKLNDVKENKIHFFHIHSFEEVK